MPFEKGKSGNPDGRPKGSQNKASGQLRTLISNFLEKNFPVVEREFASLEAKDKIKYFIDLLQYSLPKLQSVSTEIDIEKLSDEQLDELYNKIMEAINR